MDFYIYLYLLIASIYQLSQTVTFESHKLSLKSPYIGVGSCAYIRQYIFAKKKNLSPFSKPSKYMSKFFF